MPDTNQIDSQDKTPRTDRGRKTLRKLLDAAAGEFGERGFHETSISGITRRAGVALGSFYTYFDSKDAIFRGLVADMSDAVKHAVREEISEPMGALDTEQAALQAFLEFVTEHKEIYRIIDEAEFVDPDSYRTHYETIAARICDRLRAGSEAGELRGDLDEAHAWAIMGMNVFLGLRYAVWGEGDLPPLEVAERARSILANGIANPGRSAPAA